MFVGECDTRGCLRPQWITRTQKHSFTQKRRLDEREENDQQHAMEGKLEDDSLFMNCTLNLEDGPALTVSMTRAQPEDSDYHEGFTSISVLHMHSVLRKHLEWF